MALDDLVAYTHYDTGTVNALEGIHEDAYR